MNKDVPREMLYHYCGVNAFKEIIESKCLWLSHIRYMNDYMEHRWLLERAENHWPSLDKFDVELPHMFGSLRSLRTFPMSAVSRPKATC